jgi:hypothetical protein
MYRPEETMEPPTWRHDLDLQDTAARKSFFRLIAQPLINRQICFDF